ncbi:MAG: UvrD-helicase domain-containing protein [Tannerellaceae bacterium]|jgi:ATP-dependent exoDNAse (exonuclease V) beta subunit|nr:UvrD-helicase domain-containing protein [Tannerellaceae bacterium]
MLTIYRASAGAGKTYKLTGEYLKMLFACEDNYRHILAVTFTNKATDEMKGRIIEELYNLAARRPSGYVGMLRDEYGLTEEQIRLKAKKTLVTILHDYAAFSISTIDRFFQQIMRAFSREIGLQGGYGIEMDQDMALSEAIDNMLAELDRPENKDLLGWMLRFAEDKVESGGEWNLRREIMSLSREIFKERYKTYSERINLDIADKQTLEVYKNELYAIIRSTESRLKELGAKGAAVLHRYALQPSDFKGSSRSPMFYFDKLAAGEIKEPTATFVALVDNVEGCYTKTTPGDVVPIISCAFDNGLNDCIRSIVEQFDNMTDYYSAKEIVRNYYTLGILNDVSHQIAAYRKENNIMLIADTTELLNKIIDMSDAPFVYEKTGTKINHYMIDEFQDTSDMQWRNFRPLISESLAHGHRNMLVGDVKQSIYRFRNSNWKLLDEQVKLDFLQEQVREETLVDNWRSFRHIVAFNNAFFNAAPALLEALYDEPAIAKAYAGSEQSTPDAFRLTEGRVKVDFLSGGETDNWREEAMSRLPAEIERLQDNGYRLKDIAILVRTNQEGAVVADTLLEYREAHLDSRYRFDIISDDALFVSSSPAVRFLVGMLNYLKNPGNTTNRQLACLSCYMASGGNIPHYAARELVFPEEMEASLQALARRTLYEITEGLFRLFPDCFKENEQVFVQAFSDMILEFSQRENAGVERFLAWWDETGSRKTIATPDGQNAIRILTIHKSKGLGFKVVITPFCEWNIDHRPTQPVIIWCHPQTKPFDRLYLLPIRYGQGLARTIFAGDYLAERLNASVDNLNTLYVAFTRAKEELIVFAPRPKKINNKTGETEKISSIADLLWAGIRAAFPAFDAEAGLLDMGTSSPQPAETKDAASAEEALMGRIASVSPDGRMQLRLYGKGMSFDNVHRKHGALMHEILCAIRTGKDITAALEKFRLGGVVDREEAVALISVLKELLSTPGVEPWFDGSARVLNEVEILFDKGQSRRPDRVMIYPDHVTIVDYKFGKPSPSHNTQLKDYISLVRRMGYPNVEGYLWYIPAAQLLRIE